MTIADASSIRPKSRDRTSWALAGVVCAYALLNSVGTWLCADGVNDFMEAFTAGALVFQPMIFGVWTALGSGSILTRLPPAIPSLLLIFIVPGYVPTAFADVRKNQFIVMVIVGYSIFAITLVLFLIVRRFTGFRIQSPTDQFSDNGGARFSIKDMLALTTVCAAALVLATKLKFQTVPEIPRLIFGQHFYIEILAICGAILTGLLLPTMTVPMSILYGHSSHRFIKTTITPWAAITLLVSIPLIINEVDGVLDLVGCALLAQLGAVVMGVLTALPLRYYGFRMTRPKHATLAPASN